VSALTEFLLARIAEREAVALAARNYLRDRWWVDGPAAESGKWWVYATGEKFTRQAVADHIALNDPTRVLAECEAQRRIIAFHESWPILVQTPAKFEPIKDGDFDNYTYRMSQEIAWLTTREYVARFGIDPPTAPMIAALIAIYADHPDCLSEWLP